MEKEDAVCVYVHTHTHTHTATKKNKIMPFAAAWMDPEMIILSEVSQKEKDKYPMISLIHGIYDTNERICKTETDQKKKITCDSMHDPRGLASTDWSHSQITLSPPNF